MADVLGLEAGDNILLEVNALLGKLKIHARDLVRIAQLSSFSDVDGGAGMAGFDLTLPYAAGSVGDYLRQGFNVLKKIPRSQHAAILAGTSITDVSSYVDAALDEAVAASPAPVKLFFPTGKYKLNSALGEYVTTGNLVVDLQGSVLDFSDAPTTGNGPLLGFTGTYGATVALTANATKLTQTISVNSAGLAAGDMVRVYSNTLFDSTRTNTKIGEINFIETVPDGASVTLVDGTKSTYNTAAAATLQKLVPCRGVHVRDGTILGPGGNDQMIGVRIRLGLECSITGLNTRDIDLVHLRLTDCVNSWVARNSCEEAIEDSQAYAISFQDACQGCNAIDNRMRNVRHAFTTNNNVSTSWGVTRDCVAALNQCFNNIPNYVSGVPQTSGDAFDTHAGAENIHFWMNHVRGAFGSAFNFEARSGSVRGNHAIGVTTHGLFFAPWADEDGASLDAVGNTFEFVGDDAANNDYGIAVSVVAGAIHRLKINDNTLISKSPALRIWGSASKPIRRLTCNGNTGEPRAETLASPGLFGADIRYVQRGTFSCNSIVGSEQVVHLENVNRLAITGNELELIGTSGGPGLGLRAQNCDRLNVTANQIHYSASGLTSTVGVSFSTADPVTNSKVRGNTISGFTTNVALNGGSGSTESDNA
ncbi:MAG: hypothetical protein KIT35_21760 [Piscinibacter sp.]|uniref:hypothetical protein n=1 Tax=Piscinibacter sp. TaxID=1903157 RepID=UPI0025837DD9|nr:hypothetical protein [Piscinibacter sp.]MCW5666466.1 hypothetical protein [Piscinibacter sp.]